MLNSNRMSFNILGQESMVKQFYQISIGGPNPTLTTGGGWPL